MCPVCREEIDYYMDDLCSGPEEDVTAFTPTPELRALQEKMAALFERQKASGGIIDLEAERNKFLLTEDVRIS